MLTTPVGAQTPNLVGLLVSTVVNTAANRAWTFGVRGGNGPARHHVQSLVVADAQSDVLTGGTEDSPNRVVRAVLAVVPGHPEPAGGGGGI